MKENDFTRDLDIAKEFLNNMLTPLNNEEKHRLLTTLLELTKEKL